MVHPAGTYFYVANTGSNTVSVFRTSDNGLEATVGVGSWPLGLAVSPDGSRVYVANSLDNTISVIQTSDNTLKDTWNIGVAPSTLAVTSDGAYLWVASPASVLKKVRTSDGAVMATVVLPGQAYGIALAPDRSEAYVTNGDQPGRVWVVDTASGGYSRAIAVGADPSQVAFAPDGTAYVTNGSSGSVSVINSGGVVIDTITIGTLTTPFGVAVNPAGDRVYIANQTSDSVWWFAL